MELTLTVLALIFLASTRLYRHAVIQESGKLLRMCKLRDNGLYYMSGVERTAFDAYLKTTLNTGIVCLGLILASSVALMHCWSSGKSVNDVAAIVTVVFIAVQFNWSTTYRTVHDLIDFDEVLAGEPPAH